MWTRATMAAAILATCSFLAADEPTAVPRYDAAGNRLATWVAPELTPKERVLAALRETADALRSRSVEPEERAAFVELLNAAEALRVDERVPQHERERWRNMARARLGEGANTLRRATGVTSAPATTAVLAQFQPGGNAPFGGGATGNAPSKSPDVIEAEKLIELITDAIRPDTWDVHGGLGTIRYWSLGNALIITNSAEVHDKIGGTMGSLRP